MLGAWGQDKQRPQHVFLSLEKVIGCYLSLCQKLYITSTVRHAGRITTDLRCFTYQHQLIILYSYFVLYSPFIIYGLYNILVQFLLN